ncbi:uncharacterized protein KY384_007350 [Bacidia gigantensis]|uniref:uncharacterized protein n=1 Tax=Bacidia gigantensis TaxID=2732470 RepID=UPI001D0521E3|nr:uncharacterized protein KY384_007350 [Bacidia gigantensis]KAG8528432.1 hypothetical protein KY384_007350 [Bacidia gigantensis]
MSGMTPSSTSSMDMNMIMKTASMNMPMPTMSTSMISSPTTTMGGMDIASAVSQSPQAGLATSMAEMNDMCALPGMQEMCNSQTRTVVGVCAALLVLATMAVALRLLSRKLSALPFWWDDLIIVASLAISYTCSAITFVDANNGIGRHFETVQPSSVNLVYRTTIAYQVLYAVCITLIKISILLFYHRIFGVSRSFRLANWIVLGLVCAWCVATSLVNIFQCIPIKAAWERTIHDSSCINNNASLLGTAITNVLLDFAILVLPITPIWNLALTVRQKLTLTAIFLLGGFIVAAAILRTWSILNLSQTDVTWSYARPLTWSAVEISIAITCACLPTLQPLGRAAYVFITHQPQYPSASSTDRRSREIRIARPTRLNSSSPRDNARSPATSPTPGRDFYALEKQLFHHDHVTSAWASKEALAKVSQERRDSETNGWVRGGGGMVSRERDEKWANTNIWLKRIQVTQEVEIESKRNVERRKSEDLD